MWLRLSVFALCGMPALWADACDGLPTHPPEGRGGFPQTYYDKPPPPASSFQFSVKPGGPAFSITIRTFPSVKVDGPAIFKPVAPPGSGWPDNGDVVGDIEVARCQDGKRLQLLPIMNGDSYNFAETFQANDIDFDGYLDFSVLSDLPKITSHLG
jgi:hypothetical protein